MLAFDPLRAELLAKIDGYVEAFITLEELEDWLTPRFPALFRLPLSDAAELAAPVEHGLAEMSNGTLSEEEFRTQLRRLLEKETTVVLLYPATGQITSSASSNQASPIIPYVTSKLVENPV